MNRRIASSRARSISLPAHRTARLTLRSPLRSDERRLIQQAHLHLPGRQVDPKRATRDVWRVR